VLLLLTAAVDEPGAAGTTGYVCGGSAAPPPAATLELPKGLNIPMPRSEWNAEEAWWLPLTPAPPVALEWGSAGVTGKFSSKLPGSGESKLLPPPVTDGV
jgi:hypothetical protein